MTNRTAALELASLFASEAFEQQLERDDSIDHFRQRLIYTLNDQDTAPALYLECLERYDSHVQALFDWEAC